MATDGWSETTSSMAMLLSCVSIVYSVSVLWESQQSLLIPSILPQSFREKENTVDEDTTN